MTHAAPAIRKLVRLVERHRGKPYLRRTLLPARAALGLSGQLPLLILSPNAWLPRLAQMPRAVLICARPLEYPRSIAGLGHEANSFATIKSSSSDRIASFSMSRCAVRQRGFLCRLTPSLLSRPSFHDRSAAEAVSSEGLDTKSCNSSFGRFHLATTLSRTCSCHQSFALLA
jgi:hypothetical protein